MINTSFIRYIQLYTVFSKFSFQQIGHFTVVDGSEAKGDLVLIQTFLLYYVNQVIFGYFTSTEGTPLVREGHFSLVPKPGFDLQSGDTLAVKK